ncbi:MAG TPA: glycosyltransferase [Kocuria sp.]|uniref:glycosyltransferase family 2 protein n=1 Tax=Kocuria rhizophila TaxID=72000 RepID=UPI000E8B4B77|nr:glycosyltransferase family 2 protein [Kocuria rhizophila]HBH55099.1 glycosyltransferase [Kocuria sp.]
MPRLTVIMPAYHAGATVESAMRSTLRAMPRDAELVVSVDGPDAETERAARRVPDRRVVVRENPENVGTVVRMREALETTDSELVARTDADDLSLPWRFAVSMRALRHADIVCGSGIRFGRGMLPRPSYPRNLTSTELGLLLPFVNPLFHSSMLARRETLEAADAYARPNTAEDYVLWFDALRQGARIYKLAVPVVAYRLSPGQLSGAPDYHERIAQDPEVLRAWSAWARSGRMSWLVDNGGVPGRPVGTPEQLRRVVAGVRPGTRPYARRNLAQVADLVGHPAC